MIIYILTIFKSLAHHSKRFIKTLIPVLMLYSCTERIDLELDTTYTRLVVEGAITTDTGIHRVSLSTSTDFYNQNAPPVVSRAVVTISDGDITWPLAENPVGSGIYETTNGVHGIEGRMYMLSISLNQPIGGSSTYKASCAIRATTQPDSIQVVYQPQWGPGFWEVKLFAQDPPTDDFYKFLVYKNKVLLTDTLNKVIVRDDRLFNGKYTNGIGVGYLDSRNPREQVLPGDTITLMMANLTEDYAGFIWTARTQSGFNSPLFSGPPANIKGNITNGAIGFFAAYQSRYVSMVYQAQ
ncbi:MAG: DUF4249 family protein [Bacteroidales bacterium]|nr:DUF4249 family protein [Bacteroidales bacterium]MDZ4203202.1 DUF4249 family protein [Bacteroidales bacterium]